MPVQINTYGGSDDTSLECDGKISAMTSVSTSDARLKSFVDNVIIDMDIRKPDIHEKLGIEAAIGVTNYLIGDCQLDDIIIHNEELGFDVIAAGTIPPNPGELIRCEKLSKL